MSVFILGIVIFSLIFGVNLMFIDDELDLVEIAILTIQVTVILGVCFKLF